MGESDTPNHNAIVLYGAKYLRIEKRQTQNPEADEVQIRIRGTGICGTDLHYYSQGRNGMFIVKTPLVLGHEASGVVSAVGSNVTKFQPGDRVAIEPQRPCGKCRECLGGRYNICTDLEFTGSASRDPPIQGTLQEYYNHPAAFVHHLPESLSFVEGALIEPLSVALHAVRRSKLIAGQNVLILGAGTIGLLCAAVCKATGASDVTIVDVDQTRLDFATSQAPRGIQVADKSFLIPFSGQEGESKADFASRLSLKCVETCVNIAIHSAAPGGKVVLVGMGSPLQNLNIGAAAVREIDLLSLWRYANAFPTAIELVQRGRIDFKSLVTHQFTLQRAEEALDVALKKPEGLIKVVITSD
ncbi:Sorbitol dehydrogenase [Talaromyces pinophilus]|nr:Sorbitol dehydrogenase [Talaromyces pinophilus]